MPEKRSWRDGLAGTHEGDGFPRAQERGPRGSHLARHLDLSPLPLHQGENLGTWGQGILERSFLSK